MRSEGRDIVQRHCPTHGHVWHVVEAPDVFRCLTCRTWGPPGGEIPSGRIAILYWLRAVHPRGWRARWKRFIRASDWLRWIIVTGYFVTQYTYISGAGNRINVCVYNTLYGRVEISQRAYYCPTVRQLDVE